MKKGIVLNNVLTSGNLSPQDHKKKFGNAQFSLNGEGEVLVKDCVFGQNCYNCLEIGLSTKHNPPSKIDIENCDFSGVCSNNGILIFATQPNTVINIKNCHFKQLSNVLRLSNRTNVSGVVVNFENITVDQWDNTPEWAGCFIFEDYIAKTLEEFKSANRFGDGKITINIKNLTHKGQVIHFDKLSDAMATKDPATQIGYIFVDNIPEEGAWIPFVESEYPTINFI